MDAIKYFKEKERLCDTFDAFCSGCPLGNSVEDCDDLQKERPEKAVEIVEKWSLENPQKTMLQDFLEKYPKAPLDDEGLPKNLCPHRLGHFEIEDRPCKYNPHPSCLDCWNRPLEG